MLVILPAKVYREDEHSGPVPSFEMRSQETCEIIRRSLYIIGRPQTTDKKCRKVPMVITD